MVLLGKNEAPLHLGSLVHLLRPASALLRMPLQKRDSGDVSSKTQRESDEFLYHHWILRHDEPQVVVLASVCWIPQSIQTKASLQTFGPTRQKHKYIRTSVDQCTNQFPNTSAVVTPDMESSASELHKVFPHAFDANGVPRPGYRLPAVELVKMLASCGERARNQDSRLADEATAIKMLMDLYNAREQRHVNIRRELDMWKSLAAHILSMLQKQDKEEMAGKANAVKGRESMLEGFSRALEERDALISEEIRLAEVQERDLGELDKLRQRQDELQDELTASFAMIHNLAKLTKNAVMQQQWC